MPYIQTAITLFTQFPNIFADTRKNTSVPPLATTDYKQLPEYNEAIRKYLEMMIDILKKAAPEYEVLDSKADPREVIVKGAKYNIAQLKVKIPSHQEPLWVPVVVDEKDMQFKIMSQDVYQHFLRTGEFKAN
jgi:hypothetical protein